MSFNPAVYLEGALTGAGLIIAIGAQNAFVLKQGIRKNHVFVTALLCSLIDLVLISAGVLGLGALLERTKILLYVSGIVGVLFLAYYGFRSFRAALRPGVLEEKGADEAAGLRKTVLTVLALSLLNPHVYLDTVILLGGIGGRHAWDERPFFIAGAATASFLWFFGLAYGARVLAPLFKKPATWRILDFLIAGVMWFIAFQLVLFVLTLA